jgi:hypothetical protein
MIRESKYPENSTTGLELLGKRLIRVDYEKATSQIRILETEEVQDLPFRKGWPFYNSDGSLMVYARLLHFDENEQAIELWRTDTQRNIYTFLPDFGTDWIYGMHHIDIYFSECSLRGLQTIITMI